MTVWIAVHCPNCHSPDVVKYGKSPQGKQRYRYPLSGQKLTKEDKKVNS